MAVTIIKVSTLTGKENRRVIQTSLEKIRAWDEAHPIKRGLIQNVFPELSREDREFLISGITPEEWDAAFSEEE